MQHYLGFFFLSLVYFNAFFIYLCSLISVFLFTFFSLFRFKIISCIFYFFYFALSSIFIYFNAFVILFFIIALSFYFIYLLCFRMYLGTNVNINENIALHTYLFIPLYALECI